MWLDCEFCDLPRLRALSEPLSSSLIRVPGPFLVLSHAIARSLTHHFPTDNNNLPLHNSQLGNPPPSQGLLHLKSQPRLPSNLRWSLQRTLPLPLLPLGRQSSPTQPHRKLPPKI